MGHKREVLTEKLMDEAIRLEKKPLLLVQMDLSHMAAVARCYNIPFHTYGRVAAYIPAHKQLPPEEYRKPRHQWQSVPRAETLCNRCRNLRKDDDGYVDCPMLRLRGEMGMRGSVIACSEFKRKNYRKRKSEAQ